ncbi:MAG: hypothetical protein OIN87_07000 [Candidatus Methanoperedens sp.]|nr:hypothetical protein [Candidatus Methanoperedens sp.]
MMIRGAAGIVGLLAFLELTCFDLLKRLLRWGCDTRPRGCAADGVNAENNKS